VAVGAEFRVDQARALLNQEQLYLLAISEQRTRET